MPHIVTGWHGENVIVIARPTHRAMTQLVLAVTHHDNQHTQTRPAMLPPRQLHHLSLSSFLFLRFYLLLLPYLLPFSS
jgi:hypothetical protein